MIWNSIVLAVSFGIAVFNAWWLVRNITRNPRWPFRRKLKPSKLPAFLPILEEMARFWEQITPEQIERAGVHLVPIGEGDTKLGVVHSQCARRTLAASQQMKVRCGELRLHASGGADSQEEALFDHEQANRFDALEDCLRELFWAQAKEDVGDKAWGERSIGIRSGWMLVAVKERGPQAFLEMMGGHLPGGRP